MMVITTPALAAAQRVREQCEVREHRRVEPVAERRIPTGSAKSAHAKQEAYTLAQRKHLEMRERVKAMLDHGTNKTEIARTLGISLSAVKRHVIGLTKGGPVNYGGLNRKPIEIAGQRFPSILAAKTSLNLSSTILYEWLRSGKARYV